MTKNEFISSLKKIEIDHKIVEKAEDCYSFKLPDILQKILSCSSKTIFVEDIRMLCGKEILNASQDLHVEFKTKHLMPVADCGDNDFIVYNYDEKMWFLFNIVDETLFKRSNHFEDLL